MHTYVCTIAYIRVYYCIHVCTIAYIRVYYCIHTCVLMHTYVCTIAYIRMYVLLHTYIHRCGSVHCVHLLAATYSHCKYEVGR